MENSARALIERYAPDFPLRHAGRIVTDTTDFTRVEPGDVMELGGQHYLTLRDEVERRFGLEDPKFWVKRCRHLETGERKIIKLEFYEDFPIRIGPFEARCFRSPKKEARILNMVRGDMRFMQGVSLADTAGNNVRILDVVWGRSLNNVIEDMPLDHLAYFREALPQALEGYVGICEALRFLHERGEKHGDVRRDHVYVDRDSGLWRWIDFDYAFDFHENPFGLDLFGLGNILVFLVGKGDHDPKTLTQSGVAPELAATVNPAEDCSIVFGNRLANLKKIFPYIPEELNRVLMHFSASTEVFYDSVDELLGELKPCVSALQQGR